ncbi:MAG: hypothetical protein IJA91_06540 [Clostridia bacterium]|nr:hypothetical protein [Clostridia bacterium]
MNRNGLYAILGIVLMISICLFSGCDSSDTSMLDTTEALSTNAYEPMETAPQDPSVNTVAPTEESTAAENIPTPAETSSHPNEETTDPATGGDNQSSAIVIKGTIENICTPKRVHNITSATYIGYEVSEAGNLLLLFNTVKNHTGLDMTSQFKAVYFPVDVFSTDPADIAFEQGGTYLLLLHRYRDVYADGDEFQITEGSLVVPTNDFQSSTVHDSPLAQNVKGIRITENTTLDDFITYLQTLTADHPDFTGQDYIQTNTRSDIMAQSPHVVTVTTSSVTSSMSISTVTIRCRVDQVHKGTLTEGEYIDVMFPLDADVELGQTFILTLNDPIPSGMDWYMFSCKQAMYPMSELDDILVIIQNTQVAQ